MKECKVKKKKCKLLTASCKVKKCTMLVLQRMNMLTCLGSKKATMMMKAENTEAVEAEAQEDQEAVEVVVEATEEIDKKVVEEVAEETNLVVWMISQLLANEITRNMNKTTWTTAHIQCPLFIILY